MSEDERVRSKLAMDRLLRAETSRTRGAAVGGAVAVVAGGG